MFWVVNLCFILLIYHASSHIDYHETLNIEYKDDESVAVKIIFKNPNNIRLAKVKYSSTDYLVGSCNFRDSSREYSVSVNLTKILPSYNGTQVVIIFYGIHYTWIKSDIFLRFVYAPERKEVHECLNQCTVYYDIGTVLHVNKTSADSTTKSVKEETQKFLNDLSMNEESNNLKTKPVVEIQPDTKIYYYSINTNLTLTCEASGFPKHDRSNLNLLRESQSLTTLKQARNKKYLEYDLQLKAEDNFTRYYCSKNNYTSKYIRFQLNETCINNTRNADENASANSNQTKLEHILEALIILICFLVLGVILLYYLRSRAAKKSTRDNDIYTYVSSELTYAQLQLNTQEGKNGHFPTMEKRLPYATVVGVLKPK